MTLRFRRNQARGRCCYDPATRSCTGRRRARCCSSKATLHWRGRQGGCDARGLRQQAASGWHSAKAMSLSRRQGRDQCWAQPRRQEGGLRRLRASTWASHPLHPIFMRLGVSRAAKTRLAQGHGAKGTRPGERGRRARRRGGRASGLRPSAELCSATRLRRARARRRCPMDDPWMMLGVCVWCLCTSCERLLAKPRPG